MTHELHPRLSQNKFIRVEDDATLLTTLEQSINAAVMGLGRLIAGGLNSTNDNIVSYAFDTREPIECFVNLPLEYSARDG